MSKSFFACGSQHSMTARSGDACLPSQSLTELRLVLLDLRYTEPQASHESCFDRAELGCVPGYSDNGTSLWILWSDGDESTAFLTGFAACWMLTYRGDNQ
jgi:hypothetical protein